MTKYEMYVLINRMLEELEEKVGLPVLGGIPYNSHYEKEAK